MRITDITLNSNSKKLFTITMDLWIKDETILLINGYKKVIRRKTTCKLIALQNYKLTVLTKWLLNKNASGSCLKSLTMQADLMYTGRLFQSSGAAAMKNRSLMVTFLKRFGVINC